jgi:hypothetical protein
MGYFVIDPSLIALANAGLPPDGQVGAYYQMDEHEIARAAATVTETAVRAAIIVAIGPARFMKD